MSTLEIAPEAAPEAVPEATYAVLTSTLAYIENANDLCPPGSISLPALLTVAELQGLLAGAKIAVARAAYARQALEMVLNYAAATPEEQNAILNRREKTKTAVTSTH